MGAPPPTTPPHARIWLASLLVLVTACAFDAAPADLDAGFSDERPDADAPDKDTGSSKDAGSSKPDASDPGKDTGSDGDGGLDLSDLFKPDDPEPNECLEVCELVMGCLGDICALDQLGGYDALVQGCMEGCGPELADALEFYEELGCVRTGAMICLDNPGIEEVCACDEVIPESDAGAPCVDNNQCLDLCLPDLPGGYCTTPCDVEADCGFDDICAGTSEGESFCFGYCDPALLGDDCRPEYGCWQLDEDGFIGLCFVACQSDEECFPGLACIEGSCVTP